MANPKPVAAGWALPVYIAILAVVSAIAAVVGAATANWWMLGAMLVCTGVLGFTAWIISPPSVRRSTARIERQTELMNRLFLRLHITWAVDPEWRKRYEQRS
jgi:hypothetical protein